MVETNGDFLRDVHLLMFPWRYILSDRNMLISSVGELPGQDTKAPSPSTLASGVVLSVLLPIGCERFPSLCDHESQETLSGRLWMTPPPRVTHSSSHHMFLLPAPKPSLLTNGAKSKFSYELSLQK